MGQTSWVWIREPDGAWVLAFVYLDPSAGPSAKGGVVGEPITQEQIRNAIDRPDRTFRRPEAFGAIPIGAEDALRLGLPKDPPWIGFFTTKPVPPPRGEPSRTLVASVRRRGAPAGGARVRIGHRVGRARELLPLDERTTDAAGRCEFPLAPMTSIVAIADAAGVSSQLVDVPDGELVELDLLAVGAIGGVVRKNGAPVPAVISLDPRDAGVHRVERADASGRYRIDHVVPGAYDVRVEGVHPETRMSAGTPTYDAFAIADGETVQRDYVLVAGVSLRVSVAIENIDHSGHIFLFAGSVAPATLPELYELFKRLDNTQRRSANSTSRNAERMTAELTDVLPGAYTVCVAPWDMRNQGHADQPVVSQPIVVGDEPVTVELVLPHLRPR